MSTCPVQGCTRSLGVTKSGNPWAMCRAHYHQLDPARQMKLWRSYGSWQRLERQYLGMLPGMRSPALMSARASAIKAYLDVRNDCIHHVFEAESRRFEVAR